MNHIRTHQKYPIWLTGVLLILGFAFAVNYGYYTKASASERGNASITVSPGILYRSDPLIFDLAKQGQPKQWVQPDKILARYTIKNESKEPLPVTVLATQFPGPVTLQSGAATFEKLAGQISRPINPGQVLRVNVSIDLANVSAHRHSLGELQVINANNGDVLGITPVHLTNPEMQQPNFEDASHETHHQQQGGTK